MVLYKNTFLLTPNKHVLRGKSPQLQAIFMWLCEEADAHGNYGHALSILADDCGVPLEDINPYILELEKLRLIERKDNATLIVMTV